MRFKLFYLCVNLYSDIHDVVFYGVVWFGVVWHMCALCCLFCFCYTSATHAIEVNSLTVRVLVFLVVISYATF